MTQLLQIDPEEMGDGWRCVDLREDFGVLAVIPNHGPAHRAGLDCWCGPHAEEGGRIIVHNEGH